MTEKKVPEQNSGLTGLLLSPMRRRLFLGYAGASAASVALILSGCKDDDDTPPPTGVTLTNDDTGVLNYAYALEQLEAAFYIQVLSTGFYGQNGGGSQAEKDRLKEIRDHEIAHRDLFRAALGSAAIRDLQVDFSSVNFSSRDSILETARTFEDLGVSAYNGAGQYLENAAYLELAGKIVSVEARHAAYIRDIISNGSFADNTVVDAKGFDKARRPSEVLTAADPFITTQITSQLP